MVPYQSKQDCYFLWVQCYRRGPIRNSQTVDVNSSRICVVGDPLEYPLLVCAIFDIDPFIIIFPNPISAALHAKADLIGDGEVMEPFEVERLETCFN